MTVCVGVKVRDCIVFAADSAVSLERTSEGGEPLVDNVWRHGLKVFNLYKGLPIVAMTAGAAHFGPASISDLTKDLRLQITPQDPIDARGTALDEQSYTIQEVAQIASAFFFSKYGEIDPQPPNPHSFEFWIGGYGAQQTRGEIWKIAIVNGENQDPMQVVSPEEDDKVIWGGQPQAINRLLLGYDPAIEQILIALGVSEELATAAITMYRREAMTPLVHGAMPVQDAINLADFLVDLTKRYFAFLPGADVVGGDTDIATVTKYEGFKWIKRKHYYPIELNRRDVDHVTQRG